MAIETILVIVLVVFLLGGGGLLLSTLAQVAPTAIPELAVPLMTMVQPREEAMRFGRSKGLLLACLFAIGAGAARLRRKRPHGRQLHRDLPPGTSCSCNVVGNCVYDCPGGGCTFTCGASGNCLFSCAGGGCDITCQNTGNCNTSLHGEWLPHDLHRRRDLLAR